MSYLAEQLDARGGDRVEGGHTHRRTRTFIGWSDLWMTGTVLSYAFAVVNLPPLPFSPQVIFPPLFLLSVSRELRKRGRTVLRIPELRLLALLFVFAVLVDLAQEGVSYETVAQTGRIVAAVLFMVALAVYASSTVVRLERAVRTVTVALLLSAVWFLLELTLIEPFVSIRRWIYADIYAGKPEWLIESVRSGLIPWTHLLGYQLAALIPLEVIPVLGSRKIRQRSFSIMAIIVGILALYFSGQRAALLAAVLSVGFGVLAVARLGGRTFLRVALVSVIILIGAGVLVTRITWENVTMGQLPLVEKLTSSREADDAVLRVMLQIRAVQMIWQNPMGLAASGVDWKEEGFWYVWATFEGEASGTPIGVHNSYLAYGLKYGILGLLGAVILVALVVRTATRLLLSEARLPRGIRMTAVVISAATVGLYLPEAMAHHASVLTLEQTSVVFSGLLFACEAMRRKHASPRNMRSAEKAMESVLVSSG